jgi:Recombination endonuclease VII.
VPARIKITYGKSGKARKKCTQCGRTKPFSAFSPQQTAKCGRRSACKACTNAKAAKRRAKDPVLRADLYRRKAAWIRANPDKMYRQTRRGRLKRLYRMTPEQYDAMLLNQQFRCAACKVSFSTIPPRHICVDHNHTTGKVRGIICRWCNSIAGHSKDSPTRCRAVAAYLEWHGATS